MSSAAIDPPRNVERCTACGYLLTGLPDAGRCPECGQAYDQSQIILSGWGDRRFSNHLSQSVGHAICCIICALSASMLLAIRCVLTKAILPIFFVPVSFVLAYLVFRGVKSTPDDIPPTVLVLSSAGWGQGLHPATRSKRRRAMAGRLALALGLIACLSTASGTRPYWVLGPYAAGFGGLYLLSFRRPSKQPLSSPTFVPDNATPVAAWLPENRLSFAQLAPSQWRLTLTRDKTLTFWSWTTKSSKDNRITLDLPLTQSRLDHLAAQIATWPVELEIIRQQPPA